MVGDHVLERRRTCAPSASGDEARQHLLRHLHAREHRRVGGRGRARARRATATGWRCRGTAGRADGERRQDGEDLAPEALVELARASSLGDVVGADDRGCRARRAPAAASRSQQRGLAPAAARARRSRISSSISARRAARPARASRCPASTWSCRPATRTMKNSSRLFEVDRARTSRARAAGRAASSASCSTRSLNSSHDSSRLKYSLGSREVDRPRRRHPPAAVRRCSRPLDRYARAAELTVRWRARAGCPRAARRGRSAAAGRARATPRRARSAPPASGSRARGRSRSVRATSSPASPDEHAHRALQRLRVEHRAHQPPQRGRAAADRDAQRRPAGSVEALEHAAARARASRAARRPTAGPSAGRRRSSRPEPTRNDSDQVAPSGSVPIASSVEPPPTSTTPTRAVERLPERPRGAEEGQPRLLLAVEHLDVDAAASRIAAANSSWLAAPRIAAVATTRIASAPSCSTRLRCSATTRATSSIFSRGISPPLQRPCPGG